MKRKTVKASAIVMLSRGQYSLVARATFRASDARRLPDGYYACRIVPETDWRAIQKQLKQAVAK